MRKYILLLILALSIVIIGSAVNSVFLERPSDISIQPTTDTQSKPLLTVNELGPYPGGTNNVEFVDLQNNYDEAQTVTVSVANSDFSFSDGSETKTVTVQAFKSQTLFIDTGGKTQLCSETTNRRTNTYSFESTSSTLIVNTTESSVDVCRGGGGGSGSPPIINTLQGFSADQQASEFTIDQVQVQDNDGNLNSVSYEVTDSSGNILASDIVAASGSQYQAQPVTLSSTEPIQSTKTYTLTVIAEDQQNKTDTDTLSTSGRNDPIKITNLQDFQVNNKSLTIGQIQVQDDDGDLSSLKYQVTSPNGTVVGSDTVSISGSQYQAQNVNIPIKSKIKGGRDYTLTVTATDSDGDTATDQLVGRK